MKDLTGLEELYIGGTDMTDQDLNDLRVLPRRKVVYLPQNPQITDSELHVLRDLSHLTKLNIERTGTTKNGQAEFRRGRLDVQLEL